MKKLVSFPLYLAFWLFFFLVQRLIFVMWHFEKVAQAGFREILQSFWHGLRMDLSFASYLSIGPFLLLFVAGFIHMNAAKILAIYSCILIVLLTFLTVSDLELYAVWGFRMDATPLQYFKNPKEMAASVSAAPLWQLVLLFGAASFALMYLYQRFFTPWFKTSTRRQPLILKWIPLLFTALLFIPIRGGIQKIPLNISDVYFSHQPFANHAAINLPWNVMFSVLNRHDEKNPFDYFEPQKAQALVAELYRSGPLRSPQITDTARPNVVFIILESFTAKWIGHLGGVNGVTPGLDRIAGEGLTFTNIYATGDRSEKGQIGILAGYPNQAITSIIKTPTKTRNLPAINQPLEQVGYSSSFTHGGELEFANIKSFLLNAGFDHLTDKYSFPSSLRTTSWGVHDQYVFDRFTEQLQKKEAPFFATLFTLSSHEPYDVPMHTFSGTDEASLFKNAVYYTDSLLYDFITRSKQEPWWRNTLIVITADHGHYLPGNDPIDVPSKFHIPLIFTGGALQVKGTNPVIGSQSDIVSTVLHQLNLSAGQFPWSRDLLDPDSKPFAFYAFNNGFGWVTPNGTATFDNVSRKIIRMDPGFDTTQLKYAKAYMQASYQDFLER